MWLNWGCMRSAATSIVSWPVTLLDATVVASCVSPMGVARLWLKSYCCASSNAIVLAYWDCLLKSFLSILSHSLLSYPTSSISDCNFRCGVFSLFLQHSHFLFHSSSSSICIFSLFISFLPRLWFISRHRLIKSPFSPYLQRLSWDHFFLRFPLLLSLSLFFLFFFLINLSLAIVRRIPSSKLLYFVRPVPKCHGRNASLVNNQRSI